MGYIQKETKETCHNLKGRSKEFCLCNGKKNCARHEVYIILSTYLPHETTCIRIEQHSYQFCRRQNCAWQNTKYVFILYNEHTHTYIHIQNGVIALLSLNSAQHPRGSLTSQRLRSIRLHSPFNSRTYSCHLF